MIKTKNCMRRLIKVSILIGLIVAVIPESGSSQERYPEKPISIIHGWSAGGLADVFTRLLADAASKKLGQLIVVENRLGAHGIIAANTIVKSKPDGYTLGGGVSSQFLITCNMMKVPFDPIKDITQILVFFNYEIGLVVRSDSPWKTWEEFKNYAKQNPGKVRYGSPGAGSMQQLTFEMIGQREGIKWTHIPFPGSREPVIAVLGGHIEAAIPGKADVLSLIKSGQLRFLLPLNDRRWEIAPNVPHLGELGYDNAFTYFSIWGPKGLPESIRSKLENVFHEAMKDQNFVDAANRSQIDIIYVPGKDYAKMLEEKFPKYKKVIDDLGLAEK